MWSLLDSTAIAFSLAIRPLWCSLSMIAKVCFVESTTTLRLSRHFNASSAPWRHAIPRFVSFKVFGRAPQTYSINLHTVHDLSQGNPAADPTLMSSRLCLALPQLLSWKNSHFRSRTLDIFLSPIYEACWDYSYESDLYKHKCLRQDSTGAQDIIKPWTLTELYRLKVSVSQGNLKSCPKCFEFCCQRHAETSKCS